MGDSGTVEVGQGRNRASYVHGADCEAAVASQAVREA